MRFGFLTVPGQQLILTLSTLQPNPAVLEAAKIRNEELQDKITETNKELAACTKQNSQLDATIQSMTNSWQQTEEKVTSMRNQACKYARHACST